MINEFREQRRDLGLTQIELAQSTKIPRHRIQLAKNGYAILHNNEVNELTKFFGFKHVPEFLKALTLPASEVQGE